MPKISVIMPVYNTNKKYLLEAIDSVLQQTYTDFELLLVDDASTENTKECIASHKDPRLKYFRLTENHGVSYARNFGIKKATGEFLAFLDSDDIALPNRFETQLRFFDNNSFVDCVGSAALIIPEGKKLQFPTQHEDIVVYLLFRGCAFTQSTVMLRKKIITENNIFYNDKYNAAEDYAFWLDLIGIANFANINEVLVKYRWHGNNLSIAKQDSLKSLAIMVKIKKLLNLTDCCDDTTYKGISKFMECPESFTLSELPVIEVSLPVIVRKIAKMGLCEKKIKFALRKNYSKLIRKVPSKVIAKKLCFSPLISYLNIGIHRQIFYYITKGIF
ncbi:MAG: glycosyltransferase family 2 protein [Acidaminococcaceae bacterium]